MRIYIHNKIIQKPWGGGNSFLKAFKEYCIKKNITIAKNINSEYDILLFNAASKAPGIDLSIDELINLRTFGIKSWLLRRSIGKRRRKILVYRSDGFRDEYAGTVNNRGDLIQTLSLQLADHVIFQNALCLKSARRPIISYNKDNYSIIHNGVNQEVFTLKETFWDGHAPLKIFACSWSKNVRKGHSVISEFSKMNGVEVTFRGNWPKEVPCGKVHVLPPLPQYELAIEYKKHDVFLHPSQFDQSPNVCLEAISSGLPVIYHHTSGICELIQGLGMPVNEANLPETLMEVKKSYSKWIAEIHKRRDYFSMVRCVDQYIEVFNRVIEQARLAGIVTPPK